MIGRRILAALAVAAFATAVAVSIAAAFGPAAVTSAAADDRREPPSHRGAGAGETKARLTVRVADLRSREGQLIFGVFDAAKGFPTDSRRSVNWQTRKLDRDGQVEFVADLPPGKYAASVLHDENANGKMDKNLFGVPKEGYGVTNNPKPKFRGAKFEEATFELSPDGTTMTISLQYF
jgi:uncharacterized protein (DUF2141 family)